MKIKTAKLFFSDLNLPKSKIHKLRGYVGNLFIHNDLLHNHRTNGELIARYPLIQFKIINKTPAIVAITEKAIDIFNEIFMSMDKVEIDNTNIPIYGKDLKIESFEAGFTNENYVYEFLTPWVALNQENYFKYRDTTTFNDKKELLESILNRNIQSLSGGLGIWLEKDQIIKTTLKFSKTYVKLKGITMSGFYGTFKTNYLIPDHVGLGKSTARGFGTLKKVI